MANKKKSRLITVLFAVIFMLAWFGVLFTLFPVGNPMESIGGTAGKGFFYSALISVLAMIFILLYFAIGSTISDFFDALGRELGLNIKDMARQSGQVLWHDIMAFIGQKHSISDHHDEDGDGE